MALGASTFRLIALGSTNANNVKPTAGEVTGWYLFNAAAYTVFLKLYDSATAPTAGSGTPTQTIGVPAGAGANVGVGNGLAFVNGIGFTITKLAADADTTVVVAGDLVVNLFYK